MVRPRSVKTLISLEESIEKNEKALISSLEAKRSGIDDKTGKGNETEDIVEKNLLLPNLPPRFQCCKGSVVTAANPGDQSWAIDRVIFDPSVAPRLIFGQAHSIFPIESVCGLVEITMRLDAPKLKEDIRRMAPVKAMRKRRYLAPSPDSRTKAVRIEQQDSLSPRSFIIGFPASSTWSAKAIAKALRKIQLDLGPPTHVHGLYVIGVGFFQTIAVDSESEPRYRIRGWLGPDRLFRFTTEFHLAFERWGDLPSGWVVDLQDYVKGQSKVIAE